MNGLHGSLPWLINTSNGRICGLMQTKGEGHNAMLNKMTKLRLFLLSLTLTIVAFSGYYYIHRPEATAPELVRIADGVFITSQLRPKDLRPLKARGIKTIVDIRPDGEATDQASSTAIAFWSKNSGLRFHYIPVPHEGIPDEAVKMVSNVLTSDPMPTLLYCRTGRRAVRTFALAQASQADGPPTDAICQMVQAAGFSADDLKTNIAERVLHRSPSQPTVNR